MHEEKRPSFASFSIGRISIGRMIPEEIRGEKKTDLLEQPIGLYIRRAFSASCVAPVPAPLHGFLCPRNPDKDGISIWQAPLVTARSPDGSP